MGVPAFFRWLSRRYPSIVVECVEEKPKEVNGVKVPVDSSQPNPNDIEFDNLYLDMNGIIHPCTHPEDKPAPKNENEMMVLIFEYIDRIFSIVRPRRLLYMAIDGVAPRAKMNQQRSRRFRASKEAVERSEEISTARQRLMQQGLELPPEKAPSEKFDSNCITPGFNYLCKVCTNHYFKTKWEVQRHLQDQHTGIGYQCSVCRLLFVRRNTKHACNVTEEDMIFMHRESGVRGAEAKAMMAKFVREVQDTKWEWVREVPKEEAPKIISEPAKVPKPGKSRREPSPFQFEEDPMITLEEPPIKRKKTESFCLEEPLTAEPLGQASPETENNIIKSPSVKIKKKSACKKKETYVNPTERINDKKESDKQTEAGVKEMRNIECDYQTETNVKQTEKLEAKERQEKQTKASENQSENERMKTPVKEKETKSVTTENKTKRKQKDGENQSERTNENKPNKRPANKSVNEMKSVNKTKYEKDKRIESDDIIERIMEDISRTHTKCVSPISSPRQHNNIPEYDPEEEIKKAVESIMDAPEVKETLESAVEAVSESTSELMMETICEEIMEEVIKEVQEELEVENEADSTMEEGIKRELNTITKEAMLDINLEQLEQKRKAKKAAKRKSGESSKDQDIIERYDNNNNTDIIQSSQEEGLRDTIIEEHRQEEVTDDDDTEDPEEIIRKQREERKIKKNERRKQREIAKLRNILKETQEGRVVLNIGGQRFETSRLTLQQDPDSILSLLFNDDISIRPMGNSYFFDRDPGHFRIILNYLRDGCTARGAILPRERRYLLELKNECIFYRLQGLKDLVDKRLEYLADMYGLDC